MSNIDKFYRLIKKHNIEKYYKFEFPKSISYFAIRYKGFVKNKEDKQIGDFYYYVRGNHLFINIFDSFTEDNVTMIGEVKSFEYRGFRNIKCYKESKCHGLVKTYNHFWFHWEGIVLK